MKKISISEVLIKELKNEGKVNELKPEDIKEALAESNMILERTRRDFQDKEKRSILLAREVVLR